MKKNMKKNMLWMLLSLMAAAIMMPLSATAQETPTETRIAVVSDIHVMARSLLPEEKGEGTPWDTYYKGQRKMLEQSAGLFDQFIDAMKSEAPDVLLITGDLTKDGELVSHQYVRGLRGENGENEDSGLKKLEAAGIKVYVIPGNHDFGGETDPLDPTKDADKLSTANFASFYTGYGYGIDNDNNFVQDPNGSLSYVAEIATDLYLLAIDSHNDGIVSEATLTWICDQAQVIRGAGKRVIAMMHHPLFPHIEGANMFIKTYTVANYENVRDALINAGVNVILTGHFHTSDIAYDWIDNPNDDTDKSNGIYDINTGSLISYPCDYRMLKLSGNNLSVETESLTPTDWTAEDCKTWLHDRMAAKAIAENYDEKTAGFAADAYILHAEGDEHNSKSFIKTTIYVGLMFSPEYNTAYGSIFHSMLDDISNYGNDHANQTDDRMLINDGTENGDKRITLTTEVPSSPLELNLFDNKDNRTVINLYDGEENVTVTLSGRTFLKDNAWNTICLPFDVTIEGSQLQGAEARALTGASINEETEDITLNLTFGDPVTKLDAGRPYIIKWESGENITTDLTFNDVTINKTMHIDEDEDYVTFRGTYAWQQFTDDNPTMLLIGKNSTTGKSTLFYPVKGVSLASLGAFHAYFQLANGYTAGDPYNPGTGGGGIRNFVLNFGDDDSATGIIAIGDSQLSTLNAQRSEWFTLDGRRLAAKPTAKGLYIHAGRKVVIK